ncbi:glycerate kinase family protein [Limosilactobacillus difficilis]|uniref:glycerate kinase family protein n=1 Tax=Limosilactobacillus difficilis TaxID=2991838 RepID=UPI0024BB266A|nr:glycerate kinase [Limosilactobacillus difficilis]
MKIVIAPDSFKGSLTAKQVAKAMKAGFYRIFPDAEYVMNPMADGGEGTVQTLVDATNGQIITHRVHNPFFEMVNSSYGMLGDRQTAVIEMAAASGIQFITPARADPLVATTFGTGELIIDALNHGAKKIIIGLGGSATIDGGAGMAQALGVNLLDKDGQAIRRGGGGLALLDHIDLSRLDPRLAKTPIVIASDVTNPLTGPQGAARVFGPQKGASPAMIVRLDHNLQHYAHVIQRDCGRNIEQVSGAGAAGGLGAGLLAFTSAQMEHGVDVVIQATKLKARARGAQLVLTGEGGIDFQTKFGKAPYGVAKATNEVAPSAPVIVLAGKVGKGARELCTAGFIDAIFATPTSAKPLAQALADAPQDIAATAENVARLLRSTLSSTK